MQSVTTTTPTSLQNSILTTTVQLALRDIERMTPLNRFVTGVDILLDQGILQPESDYFTSVENGVADFEKFLIDEHGKVRPRWIPILVHLNGHCRARADRHVLPVSFLRFIMAHMFITEALVQYGEDSINPAE